MTHTRVFEEVAKIIQPVFLVGGSVRDVIMGRKPKDFDFCTPLLPDEIEERIRAAGRRVFGVGKKFGTLGFKVEIDGKWEMVEVTTFRSEVYAPGSRKPEVQFVTDLEADLSRRDFTMNAIAFDGTNFIDPFFGKAAIAKGMIKAVGEPEDRFEEDPLRMLRAARFASQFGFEVHSEVSDAMSRMAAKILGISRERWMQEMDKLLTATYFEKGLDILDETRLMLFMFPEIEAWDLQAIADGQEDGVDSAWSGFLFKLGMLLPNTSSAEKRLLGREMAVGICHRLKFSNARTEMILESFDKM